jgi:hypothetical protein
MNIEFESGMLRIENAQGLRWQLDNASKPKFTFAYDALSVSDKHAIRRLGPSVLPLTRAEFSEVKDFLTSANPPAGMASQRQVLAGLRAFAHGLINSVVTQLEYDGLVDVLITAREGSTDLYAEEARRVLTYVDSVWNAFYGLEAQIRETPEAELKSTKEYAEMMPFPPAKEHFSGVVPESLFDAAPSNR